MPSPFDLMVGSDPMFETVTSDQLDHVQGGFLRALRGRGNASGTSSAGFSSLADVARAVRAEALAAWEAALSKRPVTPQQQHEVRDARDAYHRSTGMRW